MRNDLFTAGIKQRSLDRKPMDDDPKLWITMYIIILYTYLYAYIIKIKHPKYWIF
jgi:hypothetical protein